MINTATTKAENDKEVVQEQIARLEAMKIELRRIQCRLPVGFNNCRELQDARISINETIQYLKDEMEGKI